MGINIERFGNPHENVDDLVNEFADLLFEEKQGMLLENEENRKKLIRFRQKYPFYEDDAEKVLLERYKQN